jgi:pimeloyl-ACP methyl ester carboxylesterase
VVALLDELGIPRAHLVGHSFGGCVALQIALQAAARVGALILFEPPLGFALSPEASSFLLGVVGQAVELPSLQAWEAGPDQLHSVEAPTLSVVHHDPRWPGFADVHRALVAAGREGTVVDLPSHLLQIMDPVPVATAVVRFLQRHPL